MGKTTGPCGMPLEEPGHILFKVTHPDLGIDIHHLPECVLEQDETIEEIECRIARQSHQFLGKKVRFDGPGNAHLESSSDPLSRRTLSLRLRCECAKSRTVLPLGLGTASHLRLRTP